MTLIESSGQIQLSVEDSTGLIVFGYQGAQRYITNPSPQATYPSLINGEGATPAIGDSGWLAVAADIKDGRGVIVQQYTIGRATTSRPLTTYRAYGFDPLTGVIAGIYDYAGQFMSNAAVVQSGDTSSQNYIPGIRLAYAGDEAAIFKEIDNWKLKFDDVINPRVAKNPRSRGRGRGRK